MSKQDAVDFQLFKYSTEGGDSATLAHSIFLVIVNSISMLSRKSILGVHVMADAQHDAVGKPKMFFRSYS